MDALFLAKRLLKHVLTDRIRRMFTMMMVEGRVFLNHNWADCSMSKEGCKVQLLRLSGLKLIPDLLGEVTPTFLDQTCDIDITILRL